MSCHKCNAPIDEPARCINGHVQRLDPLERLTEALRRAAAGAERPAEEGEPWMLAPEAAEYLHCKLRRIHDLTSRADQTGIPFGRDGRRLLFRRSELDAWLKRRNGA